MANPNKLSQFWQELKRRNVTRVLAVYIAAAFMLLELISMISDPLGLPERTLIVAFFISLAGLVLAVIVSWVYDIRPEGGMVRTEPISEVEEKDFPRTSNSWKIASYISFVVILGMIVLNIIPRLGNNEILDKSIAVLPFHNDSPEKENEHYVDGIMLSIVDNLCKIKDLTVISRETVEQYRDNPKPLTEIAKELNVSYFIVGSGQKYGNQIRLILQLTDKQDKNVWSEQYDRKIEQTTDFFELSNEISQLVADKIEAIITPAEKILIDKTPTQSLEALNFYYRGREEAVKSLYGAGKIAKAKGLFKKAIEFDSTFATAYAGLAFSYILTYLSDNTDYASLDSALFLVNKALIYDEQISDVYLIRGMYYRYVGNAEDAINDFNRAIELNPNNWWAYWAFGGFNLYSLGDYVSATTNLNKALSLHQGVMLEFVLWDTNLAYSNIGFQDKARELLKRFLNINGDSLRYFNRLALIEHTEGNYAKQLEYYQKVFKTDSSLSNIHLSLGESYMLNGQFDQAKYHFDKWIDSENQNANSAINRMHRIAYTFWKTGDTTKANLYFGKQIENCIKAKESNDYYYAKGYASYDLAGTYAFNGKKDLAYENLELLLRKQRFDSWLIPLISHDPLFEPIRNEKRFKDIMDYIETSYHAEHERVRQWLEDNDML